MIEGKIAGTSIVKTSWKEERKTVEQRKRISDGFGIPREVVSAMTSTGCRVDRGSLIEATDADAIVNIIISLNVEHDLAVLR